MDEAIEAARRILAAVRKREDKHATEYELTGDGFVGLEAPYEVATELLRLAEPQWGEPKENGPVWVESEDGVWACRLNSDDGKWWISLSVYEDGRKSMFSGWEPLNGRRVAPCVGRPRKAGE